MKEDIKKRIWGLVGTYVLLEVTAYAIVVRYPEAKGFCPFSIVCTLLFCTYIWGYWWIYKWKEKMDLYIKQRETEKEGLRHSSHD